MKVSEYKNWLKKIATKALKLEIFDTSKSAFEPKFKEDSKTFGSFFSVPLPAKSTYYRGTELHIWYDSYTTRDPEKKRLYYGFCLERGPFMKCLKKQELLPMTFPKLLAKNAEKLSNTQTKDYVLKKPWAELVASNLNTIVVEQYRSQGDYWIGCYDSNKNPHDKFRGNKKREKALIETIRHFFENTLDNGLLTKDNEAHSSKTDPESSGAYEYLVDIKLQRRANNRKLAEQRKQRDDYRCQVCHFALRLPGGQHLIDCHHRHLGERYNKLSDLISLCPTCHRIAHIAKPPLSLIKIRKIREQAS